MRVGCFQCRIKPGEFETNLRTMLNGLELADSTAVEIMAFPESMLTGYYSERERAWNNSFSLHSPQIEKILQETRDFNCTFMFGFNERNGENLHDTVAVVEHGKILGCYRKSFPCFPYVTPGREYPVFERKGVRFGVIICADGAYIEPARILALKGARIIFAPHYNHLLSEWVVVHYNMVRADHVARAIENGIWFMRANNITDEYDEGLAHPGVGYGDSYLLDPLGQVVAHAGLHCERFMVGEVDLERNFYRGTAVDSRQAARELGEIMLAVAREG